jgi:hypothetical protein
MADRKSFLLRVDPDLYRALEEWAQEEMRSVNAQVEYLLKQAVLKRRKLLEKSSEASEKPKKN